VSEPAIKLTTYFAERERIGDQFLADALFDLYERHRMHTSVLLRGIESFGQEHRLHTDRLLTLSESRPAVSIPVDSKARIQRAAHEVLELAGHGLTTLERARLLSGEDLERLSLTGDGGGTIKATFYGGRSVRAGGEAGYVAAVDRLRAAGATGATVLLAVDGTLHGQRRRARFFARNAGVPLMLVALGDRPWSPRWPRSHGCSRIRWRRSSR
jgi:PII-like signaling protein